VSCKIPSLRLVGQLRLSFEGQMANDVKWQGSQHNKFIQSYPRAGPIMHFHIKWRIQEEHHHWKTPTVRCNKSDGVCVFRGAQHHPTTSIRLSLKQFRLDSKAPNPDDNFRMAKQLGEFLYKGHNGHAWHHQGQLLADKTIYLLVCLSICLSVCVSVSLSLSLSLSLARAIFIAIRKTRGIVFILIYRMA